MWVQLYEIIGELCFEIVFARSQPQIGLENHHDFLEASIKDAHTTIYICLGKSRI